VKSSIIPSLAEQLNVANASKEAFLDLLELKYFSSPFSERSLTYEAVKAIFRDAYFYSPMEKYSFI